MARISRFTPWQTPREQLEAIFVAREPMPDDLVARSLQILQSRSRVHTLVVGPRGSGKTHLLALLYYRLRDAIKGGAKLQLARLPEDPITIVSYTRLLAAIIKSIKPDRTTELNPDGLEFEIEKIAEESGSIVVLIENLDEVFNQIGIDGQRKLRHYLQTSDSLLLMATTSVLDRSINRQNSPFYSFFSIMSLQPFTEIQALEMLKNVAKAKGDEDLIHYLEQDRVAKRLKLVSKIAGSHPRIWSIFSDVMTPGSLQNIAELLYESFDDLTPYYRDRLMSLNPQQRLVVSELTEANHPLHVQDIAERLQLGERSVARTISELKTDGWIVVVTAPWADLLDGRRTYYELQEPLVRLAFQAKEAINSPIDLIVNFLSVWFDPEEITSWGGSGMAKDYLEQVTNNFESDSALRLTRRLTKLPSSKASDVTLLGEVDDALASLQSGSAQLIMTLPGQVRAVLEQQWFEHEEEGNNGFALIRRDLHRAAMEYMGWVPTEPESSEWVARGENLAGVSGTDEDLAIWSEWLARAWLLTEADAAALLIADDEWRLASRCNLGRAYWSAGCFTEARKLNEMVFVESIRVFGDDHPGTLVAKNNLAVYYRSVGRYDEAIKLHEQTLADRIRILGEDHPDTLGSRQNLAADYYSVGRYDEAIKLAEQTLADHIRILGEDHPDTLDSLQDLAVVYGSAGRFEEAIKLNEKTLADRIRILGENHPDTLRLRNNLALDYRSAGRFDEAIKLQEQTLRDLIRILGEDHPDTLASRQNLAVAYRSAGRYDEAIELGGQTLADFIRILGEDHPNTHRTRSNLAEAYRLAGRIDEAN
jgi:tetratricopeptide (TPR) repeat protein/predicted transcriptional regulator